MDESRKAERSSTKYVQHHWLMYVAHIMEWCYENFQRGDYRKDISHVGAHLADYAYSELLARSGRPPPQWTVIQNGTYQYIYKKLKHFKDIFVAFGAMGAVMDGKALLVKVRD